MKNLNIQLRSQWINIQGATLEATLGAFNIEAFWPKPDTDFFLFKAIEGIWTIFSAVSGFAPVVCPALGAAGGVITSVGSTIKGVVAQTASSQAQVASKLTRRQCYESSGVRERP